MCYFQCPLIQYYVLLLAFWNNFIRIQDLHPVRAMRALTGLAGPDQSNLGLPHHTAHSPGPYFSPA